MTNKTVTGVLRKIHAKSGVSAKGPWTAYSLAISVGGNEDLAWFDYGFTAPTVTEGSAVRFDAVEHKPGRFKVAGPVEVNKNAPVEAKQYTGGGKSDATQDSIVRQNAKSSAIAALNSMLEHGVVALPKTQAKKYDFYLEMLEALTDRFFVSNRNAKTVDEIASEGVEEAEDEGIADSVDDSEDWSPV